MARLGPAAQLVGACPLACGVLAGNSSTASELAALGGLGAATCYRKHGKPWHRTRLQNLDDYDIVRTYGAEYRGVVNHYYLLAHDVSRLGVLRWNALTSLLKTLAAKHGSTVTKMAARYKAKIETSDGLRTCFEARKHREGKKDLVARFGGIPLRQNRRAVI